MSSYLLNMFKTKKSEATRAQILNTALELFREQGFEAATMRDVAGRAEVSLGAAYYYFPSKEAIVAAYYDYVQAEHLQRARAAFAETGDLRERLAAALHTKLDILKDDRRLLSALFRYGGDPEHPLSWFGPGTRQQREVSMALLAEAVAGEKLPADLERAVPVVLWALLMGLMLYQLYDASAGQKRTRRLADAAVDLVVLAWKFVTFPLLRPLRKRVIGALDEAGLLA